jgi:hypothetical protein
MTWTLSLAIALVVLAGCRTPAARFQDRADALGFQRTVVAGVGFEHVVYWRAGAAAAGSVHLYIDGDGLPWAGRSPAADPTPLNPLVLELMALDPAPAAYLGRPCYHGQAGAPGCGERFWTEARYSEPVVASMAAAARRFLGARGGKEIRWFGYSGGGALAMLLAARVEETASVVTVAANLDIALWTRLRGFGPLASSLNPAAGPGLPARVRQRHYAGEKDEIVPPLVVAAGPIPPGTLVVIPGYDHRRCWAALWPHILRDAAGPAGGRQMSPADEAALVEQPPRCE